MIPFHKYPDFYPDLISEMLLFFCNYKIEGNTTIIESRKVIEFCAHYQDKFKPTEFPQPVLIAKICEVLAENHVLTLNRKGYGPPSEDMYNFMPFNVEETLANLRSGFSKDIINITYNSLVFGFSYVNKYASNKVQPLLNINENEDQSIGTTFNYRNGIATAKHCFDGAKKIAIKNISKEKLKESTFYIHQKEEIDLVFIKFNDSHVQFSETFLMSGKGEILDKVLAIGFPNVPGFHSFQTSEVATISSRYTPSVGTIAAIAQDFWLKENLMLITAKIRAGNSGGPVINNKGEVIGISSYLPTGEGNYDNLGYGTVIPVEFLDSIIKENFTEFDKSGIEFIDFPLL